MIEDLSEEPKAARAAALSIASNATLITLKVVAGIATGSVAVLTEAAHSGMDLVASIVAFVSVRKAGEPADAGHPYGHEKMENMAGAIEGTLILFGAAIITFEALQRLVRGGRVHTIGIGIAVIVVSGAVNIVVSRIIGARARETGSVALEADAMHLSADVASSGAVLIGLVLVAVTREQWIDSAVALIVAFAITIAGVRILARSARSLVDESLPEDELDWIRATIRELGAQHGVVAFHKLRARQAGARADRRDPRPPQRRGHPRPRRAARSRRARHRDRAPAGRASLLSAQVGVGSFQPVVAARAEDVGRERRLDRLRAVGKVGRNVQDLAGADVVDLGLVLAEPQPQPSPFDVGQLLVLMDVRGHDRPGRELELRERHSVGHDRAPRDRRAQLFAIEVLPAMCTRLRLRHLCAPILAVRASFIAG
jgi:cation diffusion facilitator family transporter